MNKLTLAILLTAAAVAATLVTSSLTFAAEAAIPVTPAASVAPVMPAAPAAAIADPNYLIQVEDVLRLDVWGEPQLSSLQMEVTPDGNINVAYLGEMHAAGLTQSQLTQAVAKKLEDAQILYSARVLITLVNMHRPSVRIVGAVQKVGSFEFKEGDRVLDAVAQAGYNDQAWLEKATLTRRGTDQPITIDLRKMLNGDQTQNFELKKDDVINIPPTEYQNKFYVMGQVMRPMMYDLKDKLTVLAAINLAGGPTERAAMRSTLVIRGNPAKPEKVKCDLAKLFDKGDLTQDLTLQPGDVVYVPETKKPDWGKISQVLSTISSLTYIRRYGLF